jgi:hypothetical protein
VDWLKDERRESAILGSAHLLADETFPVRVAIDWAERVLPVFEAWITSASLSDYDEAEYPAKALRAARTWSERPHAKAAKYAEGAADFANLAAEFARGECWSSLPSLAAEACAWAAIAVAQSEARTQGHAVAQASHCAANARDNRSSAVGWLRALFGPWRPGKGGIDPDAEREWQRLRLAAYVLGEVQADEPAAYPRGASRR